jgi:hypothetical protein
MMALTYFALSALRKVLFPAKNQAGVAEEAFRPFDLSQFRHLPRQTDRPALTEARRARAHAANRRTVQPPAVPFNYPNRLR